MWEGVGVHHIDLTSPSGHSRVSFSLSWCSTGAPGAKLSAGFLYHILSPTGLVPKLHRGTWETLLLGGGFPYHIFTPTRLVPNSVGGPEGPLCWVVAFSDLSDLQLTDFLSSPSYIIVQSPTQSLEWHVWSSSSGNNCHAVQMSLSSGASVYECIMGFYLVPFRQPNRLRDFFRLLAIEMRHFLPVHHFGMVCLAGSKVNIQQN